MKKVDELAEQLKVYPRKQDRTFDTWSKLQYWAGHFYLVYRGKPDTESGIVGAYQRSLGTALIDRALSRLERRVKASERRPEPLRPLCEINAKDISDAEIAELARHQQPFVVRGRLLDWPAVKQITPAFLKSRYGDVKIPVNHGTKKVSEDKSKPTDYSEYYKMRYETVGNLIDSVISGGHLQALSVEDLLHRDDDYLIKNFIDLAKIQQWSGFTRDRGRIHQKLRVGLVGSLQLFVASTSGYTTWHCAPAHNFFLQLYGQKYWTFADTAYTVGMSPIIKRSQQYQGSRVDSRESDEDCIARGFRLYPYIPKYEVTLNPGDLLFNPQYCWHSVRTAGDSPTIGIGVRSVSEPNLRSPAFQALRLLDWESYRIIKASANQGRLKDDDLVNRIFEYVDPSNRLFSDDHEPEAEPAAASPAERERTRPRKSTDNKSSELSL
jgi:hypothetical protein